MIPEKIIYTDGHDVVVTDAEFKVKSTSYRLNGIIRYGLSIVQPARLPAVFLVIIGMLMLVAGWFQWVPPDVVEDSYISGRVVTGNVLSLWTGAALVITGVVVLAILRKQYAVRISTAEGEKDAVVSRKKEYISQIVNALNEAFNRLRTSAGDTYMAFKK